MSVAITVTAPPQIVAGVTHVIIAATVQPVVDVEIAPLGAPGPPGPSALPGPGFRVVGVELRYDIASLSRG